MFLEALLSHDKKKAQVAAKMWLPTLGDLHHSFGVSSGEQELAGIQSSYIDIYPELGLPKHYGFGGLFVRVWAIESDPVQHILYGIYLGAKVSKSQDEIRRGIGYARKKLADQLDELEIGAKLPFRYSTWTDRQIHWLGSSASKRGVVRQFDLFLTHALESAPGSDVEGSTAQLVLWLDRSVWAIKPVSEFAKGVTLSFFLPPEALPPTRSEKVLTTRVDSVLEQIKSLSDINWPKIKEGDAPCGLVGLVNSFEQSISALKSGKHVILVGSPGTGKTELAQCICEKAGVGYEICTATSDWTTFDTIGGYFPTPEFAASGNESKLDFLPAIVLQSIEKERWLIIDEINRADIDKAFGELFTLLSGKPVKLPYKKRIGDQLRPVVLCHDDWTDGDAYFIRVPHNWRILGTMNTSDKASLFQLSYAFMRRFAFVDIPIPNEMEYTEILNRCLERRLSLIPPEVSAEVGNLLKRIFVSPGGHRLSGMGLTVGPAIPIDIIAFLSERAQAPKDREIAEYIRKLVTQALEMYLYPQFEGKDRHHPEILAMIIEALELPKSEQKRTREVLATWTGYEA